MSLLLPLFPLELVLLPGVPLPLHIFEPRYKEMIGECLEQKKPFGVVRASSDGVADIGCTAEIISIIPNPNLVKKILRAKKSDDQTIKNKINEIKKI